MQKPKLTYFDAPVSRGEECRLALHFSGIEFEGVRIGAAASMLPTTSRPHATKERWSMWRTSAQACSPMM